jgi:hypothetical protein
MLCVVFHCLGRATATSEPSTVACPRVPHHIYKVFNVSELTLTRNRLDMKTEEQGLKPCELKEEYEWKKYVTEK